MTFLAETSPRHNQSLPSDGTRLVSAALTLRLGIIVHTDRLVLAVRHNPAWTPSPRREIVMGLDVEGDSAVADGITSRLDILSAREALLSVSATRDRPVTAEARAIKTKSQERVARGLEASSQSRMTIAPPAPDSSQPRQTQCPEILHCAETLGIPWKQIVVDEIAAEESYSGATSRMLRMSALSARL